MWPLFLAILCWPCTSSAQTKIRSNQLNTTDTYALNFSAINNRQYADKQAGANAGAQIVNCLAAVVSAGGGICDATGFQGSSLAITQCDIQVGTSTVPVSLIFGPNQVYSLLCASGSGHTVLRVNDSSAISCLGCLSNLNATKFITAASFSADSIVQGLNQSGFRVWGIWLQGQTGTVVSKGVFDLEGISGVVSIGDVLVTNFPNAIQFNLQSTASTSFGPITFMNTWSDCNDAVGCTPLKISVPVSGNALLGVHWLGGFIGHAGSALPDIVCDGSAVAGVGALRDIDISAYIEDQAGSAPSPAAIQIKDCHNVSIHDTETNLMSGATSVDIAETSTGRVANVSIRNFENNGAGSNTAINNHVTSYSTTKYHIPSYTFIGEAVSTWTQNPIIFDGNFAMPGSSSGVITHAAPAVAGTNTITDPAATGITSLAVVEYCGATTGGTQACAKTVQALPIIVWGDVTLNTATSQSITTLPFTDALYSCTGSDLTTAAGIVSFNTYTSASVTIQESGGVNTDHLRWVCVGH